MQRIDCIQVWLVRQHFRLPKFSWNHLRVDLASVLARNVPAHSVVPGECSVTVWTGHTDTLVALANMCAQVSLVSVGPLTKRAFQLRAWKKIINH